MKTIEEATSEFLAWARTRYTMHQEAANKAAEIFGECLADANEQLAELKGVIERHERFVARNPATTEIITGDGSPLGPGVWAGETSNGFQWLFRLLKGEPSEIGHRYMRLCDSPTFPPVPDPPETPKKPEWFLFELYGERCWFTRIGTDTLIDAGGGWGSVNARRAEGWREVTEQSQ